jgi:hypothetical protein
MAKDVTGPGGKLTLNGTTFRLAADANVNHGAPTHKNEAVAVSGGGNLRKMTQTTQEMKSLSVLTNADELEVLRGFAASTEDITMAYTSPAGDVWRATGWIDFEGRESESGKVELTLYPRDGWTSFVNP